MSIFVEVPSVVGTLNEASGTWGKAARWQTRSSQQTRPRPKSLTTSAVSSVRALAALNPKVRAELPSSITLLISKTPLPSSTSLMSTSRLLAPFRCPLLSLIPDLSPSQARVSSSIPHFSLELNARFHMTYRSPSFASPCASGQCLLFCHASAYGAL